MYNIDSSVKYKVTNTNTGSVSSWINNQVELIKYINRENSKYPRFADRDVDSYLRALEHIKSKEGHEEKIAYIYRYDSIFTLKEVVIVKNFLIKDNYGRIVGLRDLDNVYYNYRTQRYEFENPLIYSSYKPWNKNKKLREKDNGYRKEPVARTGKIKGGSCYRRIKYKETLELYSDLECKEYEIEGYRKRRVLNAWDIEAWEHGSKSWKKNRKVKRQWMLHLDKQEKIVKNQIDMLGMDEIEDNNEVKHT